MWFLYLIEYERVTAKFLLRPSSTYRIGRSKGCEIPIERYSAISKVHAIIEIETIDIESIKKINDRPIVTFKDQSKFGSFINGDRVENGVEKTLYNDDLVTIKDDVFLRLIWEPMIILKTQTSSKNRKLLNSTAIITGAKITHDIEDPYTCFYMEDIKPSFKVYRCLAHAKPFVSTKWLIDFCETSYPPPFNNHYIPPVNDIFADSTGKPNFEPDPSRSKLFKHKKFLFFDEEQFSTFRQIVEGAGGTCQLYQLDKIDPISECIGSADKIVVFPKNQTVNELQWNSIVNYLESFERRVVDETEIGMSIAYVTMSTYCCTRLESSQNSQTSFEAGRILEPTAPSMNLRLSYELTPSALIASLPTSFPTPPISSKPMGSTSNVSKPITSTGKGSTIKKESMELSDIFDDIFDDDDDDDDISGSKYTISTSKLNKTASTSNSNNNTSLSQNNDITTSKSKYSNKNQSSIQDFLKSKSYTEKDLVIEEVKPSIEELSLFLGGDLQDIKESDNSRDINNRNDNNNNNNRNNNNDRNYNLDDDLDANTNKSNNGSHSNNNNHNYILDIYDDLDINTNRNDLRPLQQQQQQKSPSPIPDRLTHNETLSSPQPSISLTIDEDEKDDNKSKKGKGKCRKKKRTDDDELYKSNDVISKRKHFDDEDLIPELKNDRNEFIVGKQYSKVNYKKMVTSSSPRNNISEQQSQQDIPKVKNVKRFKKVNQFGIPAIIPMESSRSAYHKNTHGSTHNSRGNSRGAINHDFDDIRITPVRVFH
ncbi:unnamed protein product [Cunninghamella blakesleeana]